MYLISFEYVIFVICNEISNEKNVKFTTTILNKIQSIQMLKITVLKIEPSTYRMFILNLSIKLPNTL